MKSFILILSIILCLSIEATAQDSLALSIDELIGIALKNNTDIGTSDLRAQSSEYAVKEAEGNSLPKVTLNGSYNRNIDKQVIFLPEGFGGGGATRIGLNNNFSSSVDLSVPIYSKTYQATRAYSSRNNDLMNEIYRGTKLTVINNLRKLYFQQLVADATIKVREKALLNARENNSNIEAKLASGLATEFDHASSRVKVKVAENNLVDAQRQASLTNSNLKVVAGIPIDTKLRLTDSLVISASEEQYTQESKYFELNSALRQSKLQEDIAVRQVNISKAAYFPSLSAVGSYQYQSQQNDFRFDQYRWVKTSYVGLKLQVSIFNGMVTRNKVQQAIFSQKISRLQREYTARDLDSKLKQVMRDLQFSREKVKIQKENVEISETALALTKERYNFGKGTFIEVSGAEFDLVSARLNYLQAILEYKSAFYDYELLIGSDN